MAKATVIGFETTEAQLGKLGRPMIRKIVEAGAQAAGERMKGNFQRMGHIRTGDLMESVAPTKYYENIGSGFTYVYPQGSRPGDGERRAKIAYIVNYGRGKRRSPRMGDKFITGDEKAAKIEIARVMQEESDRLIREASK